MIIRIRYEKVGGHYHCRVFTGKAKNMTFAKVGQLTFSEAEWNDVRDVLQSACEFVEERVVVLLDAASPAAEEER